MKLRRTIMAHSVVILLIAAVAVVECQTSGESVEHKCPGQNEVWSRCGSYCEPRCIQPDEPLTCPAVCVEKCVCKPGYIIGPEGKCISDKECSIIKSCPGKNQFWNDCGSSCEERCIPPKEPIICPPVCTQKCSCKPGYVIGTDGNCISKEECSRIKECSGQNQFWNECGNNCEERCIAPKEPQFCAAVCMQKCSCKPGYVIGPNGKCISKEECSLIKKCPGKNQFWNECGSGCEKRCIEPKEPIFCPAVCMQKCSCKLGYVIGPDGSCISKEECSRIKKCSGQNQFWNECGNNCEERCIAPKEPLFCAAVCLQKCSCKPGYVIGPNGKCISKEECSLIKKCPGKNQFWNECGSGCEERCIESKIPIFCPAICLKKCSCEFGYVIGPDGNCISKEECLRIKKCPGKNQFWNECGSSCERRCEKPTEQWGCSAVCVPKCSCKPGYLIGKNGTCVSEEECKSSLANRVAEGI